jgi:hypothetical protein
MPRTVNIVGTRCTDGDHRAAQAWYADHVHQLFAFEGLLAARLVQRLAPENPLAAGATNPAAPEYLCSYDFADEASLQAYESSSVRAAAAADRALGWGRQGIEITHRRAWQRRYQRQGAAPATAWQVHCAALPAAAPTKAAAQTAPHAPASDPLRAWVAGHAGALEVYEALGPDPSGVLEPSRAVMWWSECTAVDSAAHPGLWPHWQGSYRLVWRWRR